MQVVIVVAVLQRAVQVFLAVKDNITVRDADDRRNLEQIKRLAPQLEPAAVDVGIFMVEGNSAFLFLGR